MFNRVAVETGPRASEAHAAAPRAGRGKSMPRRLAVVARPAAGFFQEENRAGDGDTRGEDYGDDADDVQLDS